MPCLVKHRQYYDVWSEGPCIMPCSPPSPTETLVTLLLLAHSPQSLLCLHLEERRSSDNLLEINKTSGVIYNGMICPWISHNFVNDRGTYVICCFFLLALQLWLAHFSSPAHRTMLKRKKYASTERRENRPFMYLSSKFGHTLFFCVFFFIILPELVKGIKKL